MSPTLWELCHIVCCYVHAIICKFIFFYIGLHYKEASVISFISGWFWCFALIYHQSTSECLEYTQGYHAAIICLSFFTININDGDLSFYFTEARHLYLATYYCIKRRPLNSKSHWCPMQNRPVPFILL